MRTLKTVVNEVDYRYFETQIMKKLVPTAEFQKCTQQGAGSLDEKEKEAFIRKIVVFVGIDYVSTVKQPIYTDMALSNFVIAVCFRAMAKK